MNERNRTNWHEQARLASIDDEELARLAEAVETERRRRGRGLRNMNWNPERRQWDRRSP